MGLPLLASAAAGLAATIGAEAWCALRRRRLELDDADMLGVVADAQSGLTRPEGYDEALSEWLGAVREQLQLSRVSPTTVSELARRGLLDPEEARQAESEPYERRYRLAGTWPAWGAAATAVSVAAGALAGPLAACCAAASVACALADRTYRLVPLAGALAYAAFGVAATGADPFAALVLGSVAGSSAWGLGRAWGPGAFGAGDAVMIGATIGMLVPSPTSALVWCLSLAAELACALAWQRARGESRPVALCPLLVGPAVLALWARAAGL